MQVGWAKIFVFVLSLIKIFNNDLIHWNRQLVDWVLDVVRIPPGVPCGWTQVWGWAFMMPGPFVLVMHGLASWISVPSLCANSATCKVAPGRCGTSFYSSRNQLSNGTTLMPLARVVQWKEHAIYLLRGYQF